MPSHNYVAQMGNLTRKPELSFTTNQVEVCKFGLAINEEYNGQKKTVFLDCEAWKKTAVNIEKFLDKGSLVFVTGKLKFDSWEQDGKKRSKISMKVLSCVFLDKAPQGASEAPKQAQNTGDVDYPSDDIPF